MRQDEIERGAGITSYRLKAVGDLAGRYTWGAVRRAYSLLLESDLAVKRGIQNDEAALDRALGDLDRDLRLVLAVEVEIVETEPDLFRDVGDRPRLGFLGDLDVCRYAVDGACHGGFRMSSRGSLGDPRDLHFGD